MDLSQHTFVFHNLELIKNDPANAANILKVKTVTFSIRNFNEFFLFLIILIYFISLVHRFKFTSVHINS